ncbi:hypothetical protein [Alicyclobacillus sp. ALC3]|uniref:hypothetical protein n=1 Tax=Alicyclobacillus sp. ALC3 TaxID=2796143 RepID=UPI002378BE02|nr:hypothetical protein [Alicyclobacillus sp. ALC3]WDL98146.1 hypothetical protein JC200_05440 [Alicyclobacillus sp. ALC3]
MLAATRKIEIEIYADLGLPRVDKVKTRRKVYAYLAVYRRYLQQLENGIDYRPRAPKPGYENAADPDLIRRIGQKLGSGGGTPEDYREGFVARVERAVGKLPPYGREIIVRRLMTLRRGAQSLHDLPSDVEVLQDMQREGWFAELRYYEKQKADAILMLAEILRIVAFEDA